jgi:hypothetical protein
MKLSVNKKYQKLGSQYRVYKGYEIFKELVIMKLANVTKNMCHL